MLAMWTVNLVQINKQPRISYMFLLHFCLAMCNSHWLYFLFCRLFCGTFLKSFCQMIFMLGAMGGFEVRTIVFPPPFWFLVVLWVRRCFLVENISFHANICVVALEWYKGLVQFLRIKDTMNQIMQRFFFIFIFYVLGIPKRLCADYLML